MSFKLKTVNKLLNLHPTSNHLDNVIKYVPMRNKRKWGYIDENKTIFVNEEYLNLNYKLFRLYFASKVIKNPEVCFLFIQLLT